MPVLAESDLDRVARRRASAKLAWFIHAAIYLVVNLGLLALAARRGTFWNVYPLLGWGLGLAIHGLFTWFALPGTRFHERLVARERARLERER